MVRHLAVVVPDDAEPDQPITAMAVGCDYTEGTYRPAPEPFMSSGNGLTRMRALIGAFGETIERYSAARYRKQDLRYAALAELDGDVLDPATLAGYSDAQLATAGFPFSRYDPAKPIHWARGRWLDNGEPVWMPALLVYFNFQAGAGERFQQVSSNGLAAGADAPDAAARATCELMERDAFMTAWHARRPGVRIVPDRLDPGLQEVLRQLSRCGAEIELYRIGGSLPVVLCLAMGDGREWPGATASLGAHPDLRVAVEKAILEQGAVGPYIRRMMRDGQAIPDAPEQVRNLNDHALYYVPCERREHLAFLRGETTIRLSDAGPTVELAAACAEQGVRVAVADVTSPDLAPTGLCVARAIGVGAQPIDFGFGLRRLENPRLERLLAGAAANPQPHPLA